VPRYLRRELPGPHLLQGRGAEAARPVRPAGDPRRFSGRGRQAIAICFLHSYANIAHEQAAIAEVKKLWPEVAVVSSHQITREWREYERTNTAVLSAYVQPTAERYLSRLAGGLKQKGFEGQSLHHAVELRRRLAGVGVKNPDHDGRIGPCLGLLGRGRTRQADRRTRTCWRSTSAAPRQNAR
jgi:hypothetical protein